MGKIRKGGRKMGKIRKKKEERGHFPGNYRLKG
jgi:hypothetical protein